MKTTLKFGELETFPFVSVKSVRINEMRSLFVEYKRPTDWVWKTHSVFSVGEKQKAYDLANKIVEDGGFTPTQVVHGPIEISIKNVDQ